jgi:hypothetical protein
LREGRGKGKGREREGWGKGEGREREGIAKGGGRVREGGIGVTNTMFHFQQVYNCSNHTEKTQLKYLHAISNQTKENEHIICLIHFNILCYSRCNFRACFRLGKSFHIEEFRPWPYFRAFFA